MGARWEAEIDGWLRSGGLVVTASERASRAIAKAYHRARRTEGFAAWPVPNIQDWKSFVRSAWDEQNYAGRLLLNPVQEQSLWAGIAQTGGQLATLLEGPRQRIASLAMDAHELLCTHAPRYLRAETRAGWQQDAAEFSAWLAAFDEACLSGNLLSPSRLPLELIELLAKPATGPDRPPLLLAGFDRILPVQQSLFDAWGEWREIAPSEPAAQLRFHQTPDSQAELAACALWCNQQLVANPTARLLVVTQDATARRGEIERAFLQHAGATAIFEFSLGIPLSQVALARGAYLLLRWLSGTLAENELDWLFSTGWAAASQDESGALQATMRAWRRRGEERPAWSLDTFTGRPSQHTLPEAWVARVSEAQRQLADFDRRLQTPLDWAELIPHVLQSAGWPGWRLLSSTEFQAARRWQQALESCGSLGFDGRRIRLKEFLSILSRTLDETLFVPESSDAPIQIAGPAESAGLTADAIWFLGADESAWPAGGSTHPLLPLEVQREAKMPHATAQADWDLAHSITTRLLAAAPEVHFSFSQQNKGNEARPSRVIEQLAGVPQPLPPELTAPPIPEPLTVPFEDFSRIPFPPGKVEGGSAVLTSQSQCPFKAFATARLAAKGWEPAEAGLTAAQRGLLLHAVLRAVWAGPPLGIRTLDNLRALPDREAFVAGHVRRVAQAEIPAHLRERMPRRYLELEEQRLVRLISEWLEYEATRVEFAVLETEANCSRTIAGLTFDLRLDRIDQLNDDSLLVIDYKSGDVKPSAWDLPRPDDVQLPLYAGFALKSGEALGGLVFAKVRPGNAEFAGCVGDARSTLLANLSGTSALVKNNGLAESLIDWRNCIEQLARDFLAGKAEVDPRDYPKTCERCGLQTLCRIQENQARFESDDADSDVEADDE